MKTVDLLYNLSRKPTQSVNLDKDYFRSSAGENMSLHQAITSGRLHQARLLLDIGTNANAGDKQSRTPFMLTASVEQEKIGLKMAKMLLDKGASVDSVDQHGRTALSYACLHGREKIVRLLLEGTDFDCIINLADAEGNTPLMYAAMSGNTSVLRLVLEIILKYGINVDLRNRKGFSAYLLAAKMGHIQCAYVLKTEGGASDGIRDSEFFLSDKEWVKKGRKEPKQDIERQGLYSTSARYRSLVALSPTLRPKTCQNWFSRSKSSQELNRRGTDMLRNGTRVNNVSWAAANGEHMRAVSRLTTRSEPAQPRIFQPKHNCWLGDVEETSREGDSVSGRSLVISESTRTSSVPATARTQTPDLHAIFSHYVRVDTVPVVTVADTARNEVNRKLKNYSRATLESRESGLRVRERRQGKASLPAGKKNILAR